MKKILLIITMFFVSVSGFSQSYIPMPADTATWRYRFYDIDFVTQVMDCMLFINGEDTTFGGQTYHKVFSRSINRFQDNTAPFPPVEDINATTADIYYGAYRESDKKIYYLSYGHEALIYNFNASIGDTIPAYYYLDTVFVTSIDSVALADGYHKRFNTNDPHYSVIEGVGGSTGLLPALNDESNANQFMCYTHRELTYISPYPIVPPPPCTYVYPVFYETAVGYVDNKYLGVTIYPIPAKNVLHITSAANELVYSSILRLSGQTIWQDAIYFSRDIDVSAWQRGVYFIKLHNSRGTNVFGKIILE